MGKKLTYWERQAREAKRERLAAQRRAKTAARRASARAERERQAERLKNLKVREIAEKVSMVFGKKIKINELESNDKRSYHISSKKILNELNFKPNHTIEEAITELKNALEKNILKKPLIINI